MIDQAGIMMAQGSKIACECIQSVNDNMAKSHFHDYFELYYLEKGTRFHMIQDELYSITPGEFIIFSPYKMHHSYGEENVPFKRLLLYFKKEEIDSPELLESLENGTGVYKPDSAAKRTIHQMLLQLQEEQDSPGRYCASYMHSILNLLLVKIVREINFPALPEKRNRIVDIISYIHQNYNEEITLERLARHFYISPYYLCREFKKSTNSTIIQYIQITRVMNAQRMFMETDKNVTEISKDTGFSNITHFNRVYKSITGMTPSQSRKLYKNTRID
ncbi:helix-turn-helix transcriptional regulator [Anaerobium acetethylicum]|uniref:AraC-type DNA-binding protein n=1 Tax=Anaerobium acetethylicum TaxID=1619234 RepID=A0A1D3TVQ0_9FIRM|nr:AraC family transcriptional regulator [Anaerobium acetethylicum]SCP98245.1 AraC-type DNA-binding protein [Anaerobium acetethylicum]